MMNLNRKNNREYCFEFKFLDFIITHNIQHVKLVSQAFKHSCEKDFYVG